MMRLTLGLALACALTAAAAQAEPARPPITGISHIAVYTADVTASDDYYGRILGARKAPDPEDAHGVRYYFSPQQFVEVLPLGPNPGLSRLAHVAWNTTDAAGLRTYLIAHGQPGVSALRKAADGGLWFETQDPEGNGVQFVQPASADARAEPGAISGRIIHVGYMVRSRAAEDKFYRDLLGFRPYWHGAMKAGSTDWISQQVPDGHDWLEYMMVGDGSTTPLDRVDARELGVLNHFSLGVPNMEVAVTTLISGNRQSPRHDGPSMGLDGKWQANLYDPDGTRAELMEFKPVTKPCCSDFTADSPER
ncbi:MAG TPA: VOC family protein [Sphingomonas sp.]|uniref:VOC family protein n=1 Tax=Sphingomonas sp. TaxID=28214 RepID=UPI002BA651CC|nr:VOC family protein [Sphingomonas sp.]HMI20881.1 VOC family protein [Sphingomonas sp.]